MKLSKGQGISLFTGIVLFAIITTIVFLAPLPHTIVFWMGYFFALFALATMVITFLLYFGKLVKEEKFLSLPAIKVTWTYFILQMAISIWEMISFPLSYLPALIINLVLSVIFAVLILCLYGASRRIDGNEQYVAEKVSFIKQLKLRLDSVDTNDAELSAKIEELAEDIRFSDQMSHSKLQAVESELADVIDELADNVTDVENALLLCTQAAKLLKYRNEQCKMLKGVKDKKAVAKVNSGNGVAIAGVAVAMSIFIITLAVCFIVIPQGKYNDAVKILESKDYVAAEAAFAELGNYRDSKEKIEEIHTILLDLQYEEAEKLFNNGEYTAALEIYGNLNGYRDSKIRIEEINNRLSNGNVIYFGTYNGDPVSWQIIKNEKDKLLLLADEPIRELPMNSELKSIEFKESSLKKWLNEEFIADFNDDQIEKIISTNGMKVYLFDQKSIEDLKNDNVDFATEIDWWISTNSETGFMFMASSGDLNTEGDLVIRDKGVRPAIWLSLK